MTRLVGSLLLVGLLFGVSACSKVDDPSLLSDCEPTRILRDGDMLPDCDLDLLDGSSKVSLADLAGQPTVLNFWASWCLSCLKEMPALDAYADSNPDVRVIGVNVAGVQGETVESGRKYFAERGVDYESLVDHGGQLYGHFGQRVILPLTVILDADGVIAVRRFGEVTQERLEELVSQLSE